MCTQTRRLRGERTIIPFVARPGADALSHPLLKYARVTVARPVRRASVKNAPWPNRGNACCGAQGGRRTSRTNALNRVCWGNAQVIRRTPSPRAGRGRFDNTPRRRRFTTDATPRTLRDGARDTRDGDSPAPSTESPGWRSGPAAAPRPRRTAGADGRAVGTRRVASGRARAAGARRAAVAETVERITTCRERARGGGEKGADGRDDRGRSARATRRNATTTRGLEKNYGTSGVAKNHHPPRPPLFESE